MVTSNSLFNGGDGTKENPYLVATGEQALKMENAKGYFKLVDDIVVTDEIYLSGKTVTVENEAGKGFVNAPQVGSLKIIKTSSDGKIEASRSVSPVRTDMSAYSPPTKRRDHH